MSFAYLLMIGALNLMGVRFEAFRFLSSLTFERYGLSLTLRSGPLSLRGATRAGIESAPCCLACRAQASQALSSTGSHTPCGETP